MAKQLQTRDEFGDIYPEGYWRVSKVIVGKGSGHISMVCSENAAKKDKRIIATLSIPVDDGDYNTYFDLTVLNGANPFKQAYKYVTEVPIRAKGFDDKVLYFEGAIDI